MMEDAQTGSVNALIMLFDDSGFGFQTTHRASTYRGYRVTLAQAAARRDGKYDFILNLLATSAWMINYHETGEKMLKFYIVLYALEYTGIRSSK